MPPTLLIGALNGVRRRVKLLGVAFGVGIVIASAIAMLLATVLLDYLLNLPALPRVIVIVAALVWMGYALWHWVIRPSLARLTLGDVAGRLEHSFPQFDDRLRSTVDFSSPAAQGSEVMKDRVMAEATALASQLNLNSAIVKRPVYFSGGSAFLAIVIAAALWAAVGPQVRNIIS